MREMKKQAYSTPQMRVVRMRMSRSVLLLSAGKITTINSKSTNDDDVDIEWNAAADDSGVAY